MSFLTALSFLSRLAPPRIRAAGFSPALEWHGPAGAFIGLCCSLASLAPLPFLSASPGLPVFALALICSLLWLTSEIWLSAALHWDGLADLGDALGSGKSGEGFTQVLKDSRIGAFGALFLILALLWQWIFLACVYCKALAGAAPASTLFLPAIACAWSRTSSLWLAGKARARPESRLGGLAAPSSRSFLIGLLQGAALLALALLCGMPFFAAALLVIIELFLLFGIVRAARINGGLSGDYFGALIELSQLAFLGCSGLP